MKMRLSVRRCFVFTQKRYHSVVSLPMARCRGVAIMLTVLAFNLLGDSIRDLLDPRLRDR